MYITWIIFLLILKIISLPAYAQEEVVSIPDEIVVETKQSQPENAITVEMTPPHGMQPIIIIPGIMGSVLNEAEGDGQTIWPDVSKLLASPTDSFLEPLALLSDGTPNPEHTYNVGDIIRKVVIGKKVYLERSIGIEHVTHIFDTFIEFFESRGYVEYESFNVLPYDWRRSNDVHMELLKSNIDFLIRSTGMPKVHIVAHSMGGLLLKKYIATYGDEKIDTIVFIGTPHLGAPKAFKALLFGDSMGFEVKTRLGNIEILSSKLIEFISENMPSVYELLPTQTYISHISPYVINARESVAYGLMHEDLEKYVQDQGKNEDVMRESISFQESIQDVSFPSARVYNFSGCSGVPNTLGKIYIKNKKSILKDVVTFDPDYEVKFVHGDGTVPLASATYVQGKQYYVSGISHGQLPAVNNLASIVYKLIHKQEFFLPANIKDSEDVCRKTGGIKISKHSPVHMHIYDSEGNHAGITEDGYWENNIAGLTYENIKETTHVFVPSQQNYSIEFLPYDTGAFDVNLHIIDPEENPIKKQFWDDIEIDSLHNRFAIEISNANTVYEIKKDSNGDGEYEITIPATSSPIAEAFDDYDTPVTSVEVVDNMVYLHATDTYGVLYTEYSFDKKTWTKYTDPFPVQKGQVFFYSQDTQGNVESVQEFTLPERTNEMFEEKIITSSPHSIYGYIQPVVSMKKEKDMVGTTAQRIIPELLIMNKPAEIAVAAIHIEEKEITQTPGPLVRVSEHIPWYKKIQQFIMSLLSNINKIWIIDFVYRRV